jgi:carboxyl-terminal processing protease
LGYISSYLCRHTKIRDQISMNNSSKWQPFIYGVLIALGILIGIWLRPAGNASFIGGGRNKFSEILNIINQAYVDTVNMEELEEKTLNDLLSTLDPHSVYIPAKDLQHANEQLEGNFEGIGVEFNILNDTIMVVTAISGGPSQELGIQAGDRIIEVEKKPVAGVGIKNDEVFKLLRGPKGSEVNVIIYRPDARRKIPYTIKRNTIPIHSVEVNMMLNDNTGYIKINRFAANTHEEFSKAFNQLKLKGLQNLVLDLRGNPGGYLTAATEISDELLNNRKLIVYTEGRAQPKNEYKAEREGMFEKGKLVVLIDEGSASASEIVSGAVQDWDRGVIIGRRSFGKGLVQEPFELRDGSAVRLTIARYYTPSGRSIQKRYDIGYDAYEEEVMHRFEDGEVEDSSRMNKGDSTVFRTANGRIVYSGGGIMPDVFVPIDTSYRSNYLTEVLSSGALNQFAYTYVDAHRKQLKAYPYVEAFVKGFNEDLYAQFIRYAAEKGVEGDQKDAQRAKQYINRQLKALVARQLWRDMGYFTVTNAYDHTVQRALSVLDTGYDELLRVK